MTLSALVEKFAGTNFAKYELVVPLSVPSVQETGDTRFAYVIQDGNASVREFDRDTLNAHAGSNNWDVTHMNPEYAYDYQAMIASNAAEFISGTSKAYELVEMGIDPSKVDDVKPSKLPELLEITKTLALELETEPLEQTLKAQRFEEINEQIEMIEEAMPLTDFADRFVADVVDADMAVKAGIDPALNDQVATVVMAPLSDVIDFGQGPAAIITAQPGN